MSSARSVVVVDTFGDHALHAGADMLAQPRPGAVGVGGHRYHRQRRPRPGEQLDQPPAGQVGKRSQILTAGGEHIEHDQARRQLA